MFEKSFNQNNTSHYNAIDFITWKGYKQIMLYEHLEDHNKYWYSIFSSKIINLISISWYIQENTLVQQSLESQCI